MTAAPPPAARRSRRYLAFFAVLFVLAATGVALPIVYNLNQQLRPDELAAARAAGPRPVRPTTI